MQLEDFSAIDGPQETHCQDAREDVGDGSRTRPWRPNLSRRRALPSSHWRPRNCCSRAKTDTIGAGMGRAPVKADGSICPREPYDDPERGHGLASPEQHDWADPARNATPACQRCPQVGVQRDQPASAFLGDRAAQNVGVCPSNR
jgi:hypothetical protein